MNPIFVFFNTARNGQVTFAEKPYLKIISFPTTRKLICNSCLIRKYKGPVAECKEFERRFKFKPRFKYGWFPLKLYQMFKESRFKTALNLNRVLADLNRGLNSLNSISGHLKSLTQFFKRSFNCHLKFQSIIDTTLKIS